MTPRIATLPVREVTQRLGIAVMDTEAGPDLSQENNLLRTWRELDVPDGWRAEIIDGDIRLMPPPGNPHNLIAELIHRALLRAIPGDWGVYQTLGVWLALLNKLYVPDLVVMPRSALRNAASPVPTDPAMLVVEIVSPGNATIDREQKRDGYASAPVPLYLLVDAWDPAGPSVTLFEEPDHGAYRRHTTVPFGATLTLPSPFDIELDTSEFPHPKEWE